MSVIEPVTSKKIIFRGDSKSYDFVLKKANVPINLTSKTVYFTACTDKDNSVATRLFSKTCSLSSPTEGTCQVTLSSADTDTLCSDGLAEVTLVDGSGNQTTMGQFYIDIVQDIY